MANFLFLKNKFQKNYNYLKIFIAYILRSIRNFLKTLLNKEYENIYLPNAGIKNIILINPSKIKFINSIPKKFYTNTKFIMSFDWDKNNQFLNEYEKINYKSITCRELFLENVQINKCKSYLFFKNMLNKKTTFKGCKNDDDIISFLNKKIRLFENIKKFGLKKKLLNNIEFMIDRDCNLVKINSGDHRFAISRLLKLNKIPIEVKLIHVDCLSDNILRNFTIKKINNFLKKISNKYA